MAFDSTSLLWRDLVPAATVSGGSWLAGLPLANLQTSELAKRARSTTAGTADTRIRLDHGSAVALRVVWIAAHNLSASAQARVLRGTTSGGSEVYAGTLANVWNITPAGGITGETYGVCIVLPNNAAARYTTIEISDAGNAAGYVEIGQVLAGDALTPARGPSVGLQHGLRDLSTVTEAESGAPWLTVRRKQRAVSMVLDLIDATDADTLQDMRQAIGTHGQAVYLPSLVDMAQTQRWGFVGRMSELSPIDYPYARYHTVPLKLTEWL